MAFFHHGRNTCTEVMQIFKRVAICSAVFLATQPGFLNMALEMMVESTCASIGLAGCTEGLELPEPNY